MMKKRTYFLIIILFICFPRGYSQTRDTAYIFAQYHVTGGKQGDTMISVNYNLIICTPFNQISELLIEKMLNSKKHQNFHTDKWITEISKYGTCKPFVSRMSASFSSGMNNALLKYDSIHPKGISSGILFPELYSSKSYMKVFKVVSEGLLYSVDSYDEYKSIYYKNNNAQLKLTDTKYFKNKHTGEINIDTVNVQYSITINQYFEKLQPFVFFLEMNGIVLKEYSIFWIRK